MRKKIPGTASLLAFEAAARHGNFARAATELSLTEGAISRQIARLEKLLECRLFDRTGNRVSLNAVGARYALSVRETLHRFEKDSQSVSGSLASQRHLELAVSPTFASRWLIPRLKYFRQQYPDITLNITSSSEPFILSGSGLDAAIHFEHPAWAGMQVRHLFRERLIAVCHRQLMNREDPGQLLNKLPRIHRRQNPEAWAQFSAAAGIPLDHPAQGTLVDLHEMAIAMALAGDGVALVPEVYVERELASGQLVSPWSQSALLSKTFCLVMPVVHGQSNSALHDFSGWLISQTHKVVLAE